MHLNNFKLFLMFVKILDNLESWLECFYDQVTGFSLGIYMMPFYFPLIHLNNIIFKDSVAISKMLAN